MVLLKQKVSERTMKVKEGNRKVHPYQIQRYYVILLLLVTEVQCNNLMHISIDSTMHDFKRNLMHL